MNENQDPRDAIIAELKAVISSLIEDARQVADVTDQVMAEQDRLHALELENQEYKVSAVFRPRLSVRALRHRPKAAGRRSGYLDDC
ncbi:hypothetical protein, partial [Shinella sp. BE166]|uniref:hypothetical protein n=1 Tax=Shinella sp. BE166 TaxID=3373918 RepID=UPI003EBB17F5